MSAVRPGLAPATLRVVAVGSLSLAAISRPPPLAATAAGVGLILYMWSLIRDQEAEDRNCFRWAGLIVILILFVRLSGFVGGLTESEEIARPLWVGLLVVGSAIAVLWGDKGVARQVSLGAAMLAVVITTGVMSVEEWRGDLGLDVYWMHRSAGAALLEGENPYTDAVTVTNGSPFAPDGAVIEGYPYPPVVLGTYGASGISGDPRVISTVSWLGFLAWMGWRARKLGPGGDEAYAMFMLLAGLAVWPVIWFASWTEPLSIGLFLMAVLWWQRKLDLSAVALGLAVASKQYFIFLAPLLLLHKDASKWRRLVISLGVAGVTILLGLVPDPSAFVNATLVNLSDIGFRPDTQSLPGVLSWLGIDIHLSPTAWVATGLVAAALAGIRSRGVFSLIARVAIVMGLVFFLGQAFPNYWFLVLALVAMAGVLTHDPALARSSGTGAEIVAEPTAHVHQVTDD